MKTISFRNFDRSIDVQIKVDIFARNSDLQTPGFDTRFTHMTIDGYSDDEAAIQLLGQVQEIEQNWQGAIALAQATAGIGLFVSDLNETIDTTTVAQVDTLTLTGTSGTADINVGGVNYGATFNIDLATTASDFVANEAAAILAAADVVVTANGDDLIFTANTPGTPHQVTVANTSGDLSGTLVNTTLNQDGSGEITIVAP